MDAMSFLVGRRLHMFTAQPQGSGAVKRERNVFKIKSKKKKRRAALRCEKSTDRNTMSKK